MVCLRLRSMFKSFGLRLFFLTTTALVCSEMAKAEELPRLKAHYGTVVPNHHAIETANKPTFSWQGFYLGFGGGASRMNTNNDVRGHAHQHRAVGQYFEDYTVDPRFNRKLSGTGAFGTLSAGYNWQSGNVVFGVFGDANFGNTTVTTSLTDNTSSSINDPLLTTYPATAVLSSAIRLTDDVTLATRAGYLVNDKTLLYVLGGYSLGKIDAQSQLSVTHDASSALSNFSISTESNSWKSGFVVGGGVEFALTNNLSLQTEYRYTNYGHVKSSYDATLSDGSGSISQDVSV